jgi:nickel-dependent lactate racemase
MNIAFSNPFSIINTIINNSVENITQLVSSKLDDKNSLRLDDFILPDDRVLILTVDHTRSSPKELLLPIKKRIIDLGAKYKLLIGSGIHPHLDTEYMRIFLGDKEFYFHDPDATFRKCGFSKNGTPIEISKKVFEFDHIISVSFVEPNYIAGFSGSRKVVMPGISSRNSIYKNHYLLGRQGLLLGKLEGNLINDDAFEFSRIARLKWTCNAVLNPDDSVANIYCGDPVKAFYDAVELSSSINTVKINDRDKPDIIVASLGGYPYDLDFVQAKKALVPAMDMINHRGVIILCAECSAGWGAEKDFQTKIKYYSPVKFINNVKKNLETESYDMTFYPASAAFLYSHLVNYKEAKLILVSSLEESHTKDFHSVNNIRQAIKIAQHYFLNINNCKTVILPNARRLIVETNDFQ